MKCITHNGGAILYDNIVISIQSCEMSTFDGSYRHRLVTSGPLLLALTHSFIHKRLMDCSLYQRGTITYQIVRLYQSQCFWGKLEGLHYFSILLYFDETQLYKNCTNCWRWQSPLYIQGVVKSFSENFFNEFL